MNANIGKGGEQRSGLSLGERVVWISDSGPELGVVRWIGTLPDSGPEVMVGVEFENPVGSGTGLHNDKVLFEAKLNHASLIPIVGLMKEKDFCPHTKSGIGLPKTKKKKDKEGSSFTKTFSAVFSDKKNTASRTSSDKPQATHPKMLEFASQKPLPQLPVEEPFTSQHSSSATATKQPSVSHHGSQTEIKSRTPPQKHHQLRNDLSTKGEKARNMALYSHDKSTDHVHAGEDRSSLQRSVDNNNHTESSTSLHRSIRGSRELPLEPNNYTRNSMTPPTGSRRPSEQESHAPTSTRVERSSPGGHIANILDRSSDVRTLKQPNVSRAREPQEEYDATSTGKHRGTITAPSPTSHRRSSSTSTNDYGLNTRSDAKARSGRAPSEVDHPRGSLDDMTNPLYSSVDLNAKSKTISGSQRGFEVGESEFNSNHGSLSQMEAGSRLSNGVSGHKKSYSSALKSPGDDFYLVAKAECASEVISKNNERIRMSPEYDEFASAPESLNSKQSLEQLRSNYHDFNDSYTSQDDDHLDFEVGSVVQVMIKNEPYYGVIRWIGYMDETDKRVAGIEMEEEVNGGCNGNFDGKQHFTCSPGKGMYVYLHQCRKDGRFLDSLQTHVREGRSVQAFGNIDCPPVRGDIPPLDFNKNINKLFGKNKGIQGHHNSCYLDATLFSMFAFSSVFDGILNRPANSSDIDRYQDVQRVLKEDIVNPLRQNLYVRADRVMKLRTDMENLSSVSGLTCEEKDPEEFLNSLLNQIMRAEPFLKLSSGQEAYFYQLFVEKNESLRIPTVQQLFDQSFLTSDIKLKEIPSCLIIQMPRFGKQFKMYNRIFPSPTLDITDVLEESPRHCYVCGNIAEYECRECFYQFVKEFTMKAFCAKCIGRVHSHKQRSGHNPRKITVPDEYSALLPPTVIPRVHLELFAVVCIETSHYVAFVKCGNDPASPWCFFDSMADRKGEQNGYNIPEVVLCPEVSSWLSEDPPIDLLTETDRQLPERAKRLFSDAYMCMYQSSSVMMYH